LRPGEARTVSVRLPRQDQVPSDFVHVPGGRFLYGSAEDDVLRRAFLDAEPQHPVEVEPFLIARHEVTFADWMAFLRALPPASRGIFTPSVKGSVRGAGLALVERAGHYRLVMTPTATTLEADEGTPIVYPG